MARSRQEDVLFLPFHLQHCINNRNFAAQMVIPVLPVALLGETGSRVERESGGMPEQCPLLYLPS